MRVIQMALASCDDPTYAAIFGGLGRAYRRLGLEVVAAGLEPRRFSAPARERADWGELRRLGGDAADAPRRTLAAFLELLELLRRGDAVHLHLSGYWHPLLPGIWLACRLRGSTLGVTFQNFASPMFPPLAGWRRAAFAKFLSRAAWVTALSRSTRDAVHGAFPGLSAAPRVIPNGFEPLSEVAGAPARGGRPFVLNVARLSPHKGVDVLLMAWKDVCARRADVDLLFCGPDAYDGHFQRLAAGLGLGERVSFLGATSHARTRELMRACAVFVFPSRHEPFGIAALEAMASGAAVVASRVGGLAEYLEHERTALLVEPGDPEALRDALIRALDDAALRARLGAAARAASAAYTWDRCAGEYAAFAGQGK